MSFDLSPFNHETLGQLACDSASWSDRSHNCVPRTGTAIMEAFGYPSVDPELVTNTEYPQGNSSGESAQSFIDFVNARPDLYPAPPSITVQPWDITVAEWAGEQGFPLQVFGRVICSDVRFDPSGTCEHSSWLESHFAAGTWRIWNAWGGDHQDYPESALAALDTLVIYHRALGGSMATPSDSPELFAKLNQIADAVIGLVQPIADIHAVFGTAPGTTVQQLFDHLGTLISGAGTGDPAAAATIERIEQALRQA